MVVVDDATLDNVTGAAGERVRVMEIKIKYKKKRVFFCSPLDV